MSDILEEAIKKYKPTHVIAMFSGGHDSLVVTDVVRRHPRFSFVCHINTGIGIPQTREFVRETVAEWGVPFKEYRAAQNLDRNGDPDPQIYEEMVLQYGFPGPPMHKKMYNRLKERPLRQMIRELDRERSDRVLLVTGVRRDESLRRMAHVEPIQEFENTKIWVAPIWDWSKADVYAYMDEHGLKRNPVSNLLHMSGECLCVTGDTLIETPSGWQSISDVQQGQRVWALSGDSLIEQPVAKVYQNGEQEVFEMKPFYLRPIRVTTNHPVLVRPYSFEGHDLEKVVQSPRWCSVLEMKTHYEQNKKLSPYRQQRFYVGYPFKTKEKSLGLTKPQLELLGYFISEGAYIWRKDKYRNCAAGAVFTISTKSREMGQRIKKVLSESFGGIHVGWREYTDKRNGREFIMIRSGKYEVSDFISEFIQGRYAREKQFVQSVLNATRKEQEIILNAMWDGDGSEYEVARETANETVRAYGTTSLHLAMQVQEMLLRTGEIYGINRSGNNSYLVRQSSGMDTRYGFIQGGFLWAGLQHIKAAGVAQTYNLGVFDNPNYKTNAGLVHNCGAFAHEGELAEIRSFYPETAAEIERIQEKVMEKFPWGWEDRPPPWWLDYNDGQDFIPGLEPEILCTGCAYREETA